MDHAEYPTLKANREPSQSEKDRWARIERRSPGESDSPMRDPPQGSPPPCRAREREPRLEPRPGVVTGRASAGGSESAPMPRAWRASSNERPAHSRIAPTLATLWAPNLPKPTPRRGVRELRRGRRRKRSSPLPPSGERRIRSSHPRYYGNAVGVQEDRTDESRRRYEEANDGEYGVLKKSNRRPTIRRRTRLRHARPRLQSEN